MIGGAIIAILLVVAGLGGMLLSWRVRTMRQGGMAVPEAPAERGAVLATAHGLYLSTTFTGRPLERVVAGGLGFRARATLSATDAGVLVERRGNRPMFIDRAHLVGAGDATWTIDRSVERDGLTVLRWRLGDGADAAEVDSTFRLDPADRAVLTAAIPPNPEVPHGDHQ